VITAQYPDPDRPFTAAVITLSDKGSKGEREDKSGPTAVKMLEEAGYEVVETMIIPDEPALLKAQLMRLADQRQVDLILTSGGTGFSLRDQTPEATMAVADRNAPGIAEYIRMRSAQITDRAMLSRGVSVIRKGTLIINLPGSPKAVHESLEFILHALDHGLRILRGSVSDCARQ
jgi:molybdenum cofactor synthesis domain-containing protein